MPTASQPTTNATANRPRRPRWTVIAARALVGLLSFAVNGAVCLVLPGAPRAETSVAVVGLAEDLAQPIEAPLPAVAPVRDPRRDAAQGPGLDAAGAHGADLGGAPAKH